MQDVKNLFATTKIPLSDCFGEAGGTPTVDECSVSFNGVGDDSHESCYISRTGYEDFEFCKTARKPYDAVVVDVLKLARKYNPSIKLSSDGGPEIFG